MSAPVDVLAALRGVVRIAKAASNGIPGNAPRIERAEQALAAVAELIEADREYDAARIEAGCTKSAKYDAQWPRLVAAKARRTAALARVQGGAA